jgi:hypothetical protein
VRREGLCSPLFPSSRLSSNTSLAPHPLDRPPLVPTGRKGRTVKSQRSHRMCAARIAAVRLVGPRISAVRVGQAEMEEAASAWGASRAAWPHPNPLPRVLRSVPPHHLIRHITPRLLTCGSQASRTPYVSVLGRVLRIPTVFPSRPRSVVPGIHAHYYSADPLPGAVKKAAPLAWTRCTPQRRAERSM